MAGQTPRFGLNFFGGAVDGSLADDGEKYTSADRVTLDAVLAALEKHDHRLTTTLGEPTEIPDVQLASATDGALEGGTEYFYVVSFVDAAGLETPPGPENSVTTPEAIQAPDAPSAETATVAGNSLENGAYYYCVSGLLDDQESPQGEAFIVTLVGDDNTVNLTLPDLEEATSLQVWRQKDTDPQWTRIGTSSSGTFTDDGSVPPSVYGDPSNIPADFTTGADNFSVTITLTGQDLTTVQTSAAWRIYRTTDSGTYAGASLVHEVTERAVDGDPTSALLTSWEDDGDDSLSGAPQAVSSQLQIPPFTFESADPLPDATPYPENYPILDGAGTLYIRRQGAWAAVSGGSGGAGSASTIPAGWSANTAYSAGDVVLTNIGYYICLVANTGVQPDYDDAQDGVLNWRLLGARLAFHVDINGGLDYDPAGQYPRGCVVRRGNGLYVQQNDATLTGYDPADPNGPWTFLEWTVPAGGTAGQVLTKASSSDGDYAWANPGTTPPTGSTGSTGSTGATGPTGPTGAGGGTSSDFTAGGKVLSRQFLAGTGTYPITTTGANQAVFCFVMQNGNSDAAATIDGQPLFAIDSSTEQAAVNGPSMTCLLRAVTTAAGSHNLVISGGDSSGNLRATVFVVQGPFSTITTGHANNASIADVSTPFGSLGVGSLLLAVGDADVTDPSKLAITTTAPVALATPSETAMSWPGPFSTVASYGRASGTDTGTGTLTLTRTERAFAGTNVIAVAVTFAS